MTPRPPRRRDRGFSVLVNDRIARMLEAEGRKYGLTPRLAARELLRVIAEDNLFEAVLGDEYGAPKDGVRP